jgi:2-polyprenyl-6-methoxyphenol hydroxylase-like FAD-dependent oxidoreductase
VIEWDKSGSVEQMLRVYKDFDPVFKKLISKVNPKDLKVWKLLDMEPLPTFCNGKLVLVGDAAHPFTPRRICVELFKFTTF